MLLQSHQGRADTHTRSPDSQSRCHRLGPPESRHLGLRGPKVYGEQHMRKGKWEQDWVWGTIRPDVNRRGSP